MLATHLSTTLAARHQKAADIFQGRPLPPHVLLASYVYLFFISLLIAQHHRILLLRVVDDGLTLTDRLNVAGWASPKHSLQRIQ